ncbi:hypothetical protein ARTHRO9AX_190145 [Arthrobacter sp. 9AX]|nr:hypothetical protein ARTHRO9AX_190145 [Arthrobacter sp. 9AX]
MNELKRSLSLSVCVRLLALNRAISISTQAPKFRILEAAIIAKGRPCRHNGPHVFEK